MDSLVRHYSVRTRLSAGQFTTFPLAGGSVTRQFGNDKLKRELLNRSYDFMED